MLLLVIELNKYQNTQLQQNIAQYQLHSEVSLSKQQLTDRDMEIVVKLAIVDKQCTKLFLAMNKITSIGASIIASTLHNNTTLVELYLGYNRVSDTGVDSFAQALAFNNNTIKGLDLQDNEITDLGAENLADMLKTNKTLTYLWLRKNKISGRGVQLLANVLENHNTSLEWLFLCENKLVTDSSVDSLCDMIKGNQSLKGLGLIDCNLSLMGKQILQKLQQSNKDFALFV